jgi:two-component system, cell cycle sensor histidine kinase and response regulator CckA
LGGRVLVPIWEHRGIRTPVAVFLPGIVRSDIRNMNTAVPFRWPVGSPELSEQEKSASFGAIFESAPIAVARCDAHGFILNMNPCFGRVFFGHTRGAEADRPRHLRIVDLVSAQERERAEFLLNEFFDSLEDSVRFELQGTEGGPKLKWMFWRERGATRGSHEGMLMVEALSSDGAVNETQLQSERWEAIGRLAGGVVHDFNNLLTGIMLYCDLLLSSFDTRDRRRRYADEIRSAVVQATGLIGQLLVFARPKSACSRPLSLNRVAEEMRGLLRRLIGENIQLDLKLDPELGLIGIDPAQAQQILLNLVLNSRDALPAGGRISIETSNCKFEPVTAIHKGANSLPCVMLVVTDNGVGMSAATRQRLFEPFFTTKNDGRGTGLGLTTVRGIVAAHRGLIHFESEPGHGTRVLVLLPRLAAVSPSQASSSFPASPTSIQEGMKESLL